MRERLIQYVDLLFAGAQDCEDIKQEILQNTLDRYDDLIAEGKVPEAAYRLAITGIGDLSEILGTGSNASAPVPPNPTAAARPTIAEKTADGDTPGKKLLRAIAIGLYIISFIPMFILAEFGMETIGLCCVLVIVALATVLIILGAKKESPEEKKEKILTPKQELRKSISNLIGTIALVVYFILSFTTNAWYITWLVFPIAGAVKGLVKAILDLKEAVDHEN